MVCALIRRGVFKTSRTARKITARLNGLLSKRSVGIGMRRFHRGVFAVTRHENHVQTFASFAHARGQFLASHSRA